MDVVQVIFFRCLSLSLAPFLLAVGNGFKRVNAWKIDTQTNLYLKLNEKTQINETTISRRQRRC